MKNTTGDHTLPPVFIYTQTFSIQFLFLCETKTRKMSNLHPIRDESLKHFSMVTKLIHYSSKFTLNEDGRHTKQHPPTRNHRLSSSSDLIDKFVIHFSNLNKTNPNSNLDQMKVVDFV